MTNVIDKALVFADICRMERDDIWGIGLIVVAVVYVITYRKLKKMP